MIESKLNVKNANSGKLFRPDWVSSAECMPHRIEQLKKKKKKKNRTTSVKTVVYKVLVVMTIRVDSSSKARPLTTAA